MTGWRTQRLADVILDIKDGGTPSRSNPSYFGGAITWCVVKDIQPEIHASAEYLTPSGLANCSAKVWPIGSVIISLGATIGEIGIAKVPVATKQGLAGIVPNPERVTSEFLAYALHEQVNTIRAMARGATIKEVRPKRLADELLIHTPPLDEQRRIVAVLDEAFAAIATATANAERNLANARLSGRLALESLLSRLVAECDEVEIRELAEIESGAGFPDRFQGKADEAIPFFKVGDMNTPGNETIMTAANHTISEITRSQLRARVFPVGSVLFPKVGGAIATDKKRLVGVPCCVDNNVMGIIPNPEKLDATLLLQLMVNKPLKEFSNDAGLPSIRKSTVAAWRVRVPKELETQKLLAERLTDIAAAVSDLTEKYGRKLHSLNELKQSLLHRAFSGELSEREPIPA
ncbi:hypothetical protein G7078_09455 [Sphingomonas sinipercae]|uniref:Type I restriction modification DNA specificity domain-containing protein n=1 Tax=Sphingomonas sinipercae TaxID=2714944 RepID=A0A6G7ZPR1_9SPHN|nr:restriction endonuclease subunit S [Sphingomonas sinipercae]QIL02977.1 hypothetical protein G7078_09455 [Sphingomonas sinipercae]